MSFCSNCGAELTEGTAFCPNCGAGQVRTFGAEEPTAVVPEPEVIPAEPVSQAPVYQEPVYQAPVYQAPVYQPEPATLPTSAKILGRQAHILAYQHLARHHLLGVLLGCM